MNNKTCIRVRHEKVEQLERWNDDDGYYETIEFVDPLGKREFPIMRGISYDLCPRCGGGGVIPKPDTLREKRKKARKGLNETARKMGISGTYLCDLEHGRRAWDGDLIEAFNKAIE